MWRKKPHGLEKAMGHIVGLEKNLNGPWDKWFSCLSDAKCVACSNSNTHPRQTCEKRPNSMERAKGSNVTSQQNFACVLKKLVFISL